MHDLFEISTPKTSDEKRPTHVCALRTHCRNDILIRRTAHDRERSTARHSVTVPDMSGRSLCTRKSGTLRLISCPGTSSRRAFVCRTQGLGASPEPLRNIFDTTASAVRSPSFKISTRALFAHTASTDLPAQHRLHPVTCVSPAWRHNAYPSPFHHRATAGFPPSDVSRRGCFSSLPDRFTWAAQRLPLCTGTQKTAAALLRGSPMGYREQIRSGPVHPPEIFDLGYWRAFSPFVKVFNGFCGGCSQRFESR